MATTSPAVNGEGKVKAETPADSNSHHTSAASPSSSDATTLSTSYQLPPYTTPTPTPAHPQLTFPFPTAPSVPLPTTPHAWLPAFQGKLLQGTCGWTDASITKGNHFYPPHIHASNAVDRLRHYSATFPCVEVDSSNYAIPPSNRVASWVSVVPSHFLFHFKVWSRTNTHTHTDTHIR